MGLDILGTNKHTILKGLALYMKEKNRYLLGTTILSGLFLILFLSFFAYGKRQIDTNYNYVLKEEVLEIETHLQSKTHSLQRKEIQTLVTDYMETEGFLQRNIFTYDKNLQENWNMFCTGCIVFFLLFFLFQLLFGCIGFQKIYQQVEEGESLLGEITGAGMGKHTQFEQWESWRQLCDSKYRQGVIGRLYEEIWKVAQLVKERETKQTKERQYLKDMMSDISHQMKTPLASLQVFLDIFQKEFSKQACYSAETTKERKTETITSTETKENTTEILIKKPIHSHSMLDLSQQAIKQVERMRWLVTGLLKLAQIEAGTFTFQYKTQSVVSTLENCVNALSIKLKEKQQHVVIYGEKDILLKQDSHWLQEAFLNILKNASEYAPENSVIETKVEQTSLALIITIEDKGPGIAEEELPKIFNRFYRIPSAGQNDGVGIGLALSKSIIERQGGNIRVYSKTGEASYTRFEIIFLKKL